MSALHERLVAKVAEFTDDPPRCASDRPWFCGADDYELAVAAMRAVLELHAPRPFDGQPSCYGCEQYEGSEGHPRWPCDTVDAVASALGIETGDHR